jgi:hypothetical protein
MKRVGWVAGVLVGIGAAGWFAAGHAAPPVDPALAAAVLPAIDEELERGPWPGMLSGTGSGARWFCVERVIEIDRAGDELTVGIEALCEEYAASRHGDALVAGSGERGPKVVVLDGRRVEEVASPPDGAAHGEWVRRNFTASGAAEVGRPGLPGEEPAAQARQAFGLPPTAPVRTG